MDDPTATAAADAREADPDTLQPFYVADGLRPEDSIGLLMRRALTSIAAQVDRRLVGSDLTQAQWVPLYKIHRCGALPAAALARELHLDPAAVTRALDRLEAKQLVRRVRSSSDRRVVMIELTDTGRDAAAVVPGVLAEVLNRHLAGFSQAEWHTLVELLQRVVANADAMRDSCCNP